MKKISISILVMLLVLSINSKAQLNYLFSATSRPYVPVAGGTTPHLITDYPGVWQPEDEGFARVPIGFTFNYDGENYTQANVDVNGFITLGGTLDVFYNYPYFRNNLAAAPPYNKRPVIAAFWDDLLLLDTSHLVYKTTGHAPFRVFTIEWKKAKWVYESLAPVLSIELKLYETTNIIEFHYKDEGSLPDPRYSYASIGITSAYANRDFISLQNTSSHPNISLLRANDSLHVKPADNQVYLFIPSFVKMPAPLEPSLSYTNNKVSFKLQSGGFNSYEYAITHSPIPPSSGTRTFSPNVTVSSLSPATTYYIYARSSFFGWFNSQWVCDSFTTAVNPVEVPYSPNLNGVTNPPFLPYDMRQQDFEDTSFWYDPSLGWFGLSDFPNVGSIGFGYYQVDFYNANVWLYTPGLNLKAGKTYQLKFGYISNFEFNPGDPSTLEVKYGKAAGAAAMTSGTLFKKTNITNSDIAKDTVIEFSPQQSGTYYFGFHDLSLFLQGWLAINNISIIEKTTSSQAPYVLNGKSYNLDNVLNWVIKDNKIATRFEVERSADGINFIKIGDVNSATVSKNNTNKAHTTFRVHRNREISDVANNSEKRSKVFDEIKPVIELQRSEDGINFTKINEAHSKIADALSNVKTGFEYADHEPIIGANYYRLGEMNNGKMIYSNIVKLERKLQVDDIYPNPVRDMLTVKITSGNVANATLIVTDVSGKILNNKSIQLTMGINEVQLALSNLPANTYFLKIISGNGSESVVKKFLKE